MQQRVRDRTESMQNTTIIIIKIIAIVAWRRGEHGDDAAAVGLVYYGCGRRGTLGANLYFIHFTRQSRQNGQRACVCANLITTHVCACVFDARL